jgi:hypothetical protein
LTALIRSTSKSSNRPRILSSTMKRFPAMQLCPALTRRALAR